MKPQTTKKLFAFIIIMMFSAAIVNAQCKGNKVQMCKEHRTSCVYLCVPLSQIAKYESEGWGFFCSCGYGIVNNNAPDKSMPKKTRAKTPADNAIASNKVFRR